MLIELRVANFLSFQDETVFSMRAGKITKQHRNHVRKLAIGKVVRGGVLFGANAAGKSNLLKALALTERMMIDNSCRCLMGKQFMMSEKVSPIISISIEYEFHGQAFCYRIDTDGSSIFVEELNLLDTGTPELLFSRHGLDIALGERLKGYSWYEQRTFKIDAFYLMKLMEDGLWDRRAELPESKVMLNACRGMKQFIVIDSNEPSLRAEKYYAKLQKKEFVEFLKALLHWADMGITNVAYRKLPTHEADLIIQKSRSAIPSELKDGWLKVIYDHPAFYILMFDKGIVSVHEICCQHGEGRLFRASDESQGTIKLIQLSSLLFQLKTSRNVWCVDEFDSRFHTVMNQMLLKWYMSEPDVKSQLIITAHDTNLLTQEIWRTDEVWFVEKDKDGKSCMKPLYSFSPRFDKKLAKGYLSNTYGALPDIKGPDFQTSNFKLNKEKE